MASRTAVAAVVLGTLGCSRVRDIPLSELPKLSAERRQSDQPVVVTSRNGKRVLIDSFKRVEVMWQHCPNEDDCYDVREDRIERLQSIRVLSGQVELVGLEGRRRIVSAKDSDPHGLRAIFVGQMSGAAAGGTTLIFTLPATRHLGSEVE